MPEAEGHGTELYEDPAGRSAVRDFLDRLDARDRAKVHKKLEMIRSVGWTGALEVGILKNFGGHIYKVVVKGTSLRLLGFRARTRGAQALVLIAAFRKAFWKPRRKREILERAERLREEWLRRHGWGST